MNKDLQNLNEDELDEAVDDILEGEQKRRQALRLLLDWQRDRENHQIALPAEMGTSKSYLMSVSLGWVASNVYFARDLPIFKKYRQKDSDTISINDTTITYLQQREPDWRRQLPMAIYLATRKHHKFPPLLLVAYQDWVYNKNSNNWGPDERALEPSLKIEPLDTKSFLVDLDTTNTHYFALDGQHRLMAIRGLKELLEGRLNAKKKDGASISGKSKTREEIEKYYEENCEKSELEINSLQEMLNEVIGVEIIPAVQTNETYKEAVSRLRNVFVDVNENAKRLEKGQLSMLDENNGFRIVGRTLMTKHPLLRNRVDTKSNQLSENSEDYTTLSTVVNIATEYLGQMPRFAEWKNPILGLKDVGLMRPEDEEISDGLARLDEYFKELEILPSHHDMMQGESVKNLRNENEGNILFRPIAQVALAKAVASLQLKKALNLQEMIQKLVEHEKARDLRLISKETPWFGILCDPITKKIRRQKASQILCERMFFYLLGGGIEDKNNREMLRSNFFEARQGSTESGELKAYDMSGALVEKDNFYLPHPWQ